MSKPMETQPRPTEIQQRQAIEAAQGYLILEMPDAALRPRATEMSLSKLTNFPLGDVQSVSGSWLVFTFFM